jgi:hypothetical protein
MSQTPSTTAPCFWPLGPPDAATLALVKSGAFLSEILAKYYEGKHGPVPALAATAAVKGAHFGLEKCPVPTMPSLANLKQKHLVIVFASIAIGTVAYHAGKENIKPYFDDIFSFFTNLNINSSNKDNGDDSSVSTLTTNNYQDNDEFYVEVDNGKTEGNFADIISLTKRSCIIFEKITSKESQYRTSTQIVKTHIKLARDMLLCNVGLSDDISALDFVNYILSTKGTYGLAAVNCHISAIEQAVDEMEKCTYTLDAQMPSRWLPSLVETMGSEFAYIDNVGETHLHWMDLERVHESEVLSTCAMQANLDVTNDARVSSQEFVQWLLKEMIISEKSHHKNGHENIIKPLASGKLHVERLLYDIKREISQASQRRTSFSTEVVK